jgi:hypothetical protein
MSERPAILPHDLSMGGSGNPAFPCAGTGRQRIFAANMRTAGPGGPTVRNS